MVRYYSYRSILSNQKKKKKKRIRTLIFFILLIISAISLKKVFFDKLNFGSIYNIFKINDVLIYSNTTTIPNQIIYDYLKSRSLSIFNFKRILKNLKNQYPEIKQIKYTKLLKKNPEINIISFTPICYCKANDEKFFSSDIGWYKVYDPTKINNDKLFEVKYEDAIDDKFLKKIHNKITSIGLSDFIKEIYFKKNRECDIVLNINNAEQIMLIDENFDSIDSEKLIKLINYISGKNVRIYGRTLSDGKVFIE